MRIGLRGAPHSKSWAIGKRDGHECNRHANNPSLCAGCLRGSVAEAERCDENAWWCEMKASELLEQEVAQQLRVRGHQVFIADKSQRLGYPAPVGDEQCKVAMREMWSNGLDVSLSIHTNSARADSRGIQCMWPTTRNPKWKQCIHLCEHLMIAFKRHYNYMVRARFYSSYEGNMAPCPHSYLEVDYGNSNPDAARDFLRHYKEYATAIVEGLEAWWVSEGHSLPNQKPAPPTDSSALISRLKSLITRIKKLKEK